MGRIVGRLARGLARGTVVLALGASGCGDASGPTPLTPTSAPTPPAQALPIPLPIPTANPRLPPPKPKPSPSALATPVQLSPPSGSVLNGVVRAVTLTWRGVSDPSGVIYLVDLRIRPPGSKKWEPPPKGSDYYGTCVGRLAATSCVVRFVDPWPGRWRVTAVNGEKLSSEPSPWWTFRFN